MELLGAIIGWGIVGLVILILIGSSVYTVQQQTAAIIERFGKYKRTTGAGIHVKIPFGIESIVSRESLRINQLDLGVETKTKDDVFVVIKLAVQYLIPSINDVFNAHYKLSDPKKQMDAWVFDAVRAQVPTMKLDEVFENKKEIAEDVELRLKENMEQYGFKIVRALVNDIEPDAKVKNAMNEVNTQQRLQVAAQAEGEKKKILVVKDAEAQAESKRLQGEGMANQRRAIVKGYQDSVADFTKTVRGSSAKEIMDMVIITQYFDTLEKLGADARSKVVFLPSSPNAVGDFMNQLRTTIASGEEVSHPSGDPIAGEETKIKPTSKKEQA